MKRRFWVEFPLLIHYCGAPCFCIILSLTSYHVMLQFEILNPGQTFYAR
jgi:hypothetical protein